MKLPAFRPAVSLRQVALLAVLTFSLFPGIGSAAESASSKGGGQGGPLPATAVDFMVREGDVWVMVGDSITWQNLYTVYLEAFVRARYPKLTFVTVNSGKSGEVYIQGIVRFRDTIAAYKPTLVTVNYGMNDHTKVFPGEQNFLDDPKSPPQRFVDAVRGTGARPVILSASPLLAPAGYTTDGGRFQLTNDVKTKPGGWRSNPVNKLFAEKMAQLAARNQIPFLDQMTPLQAIWGANYGRDQVAALRQALRPLLDVPITEQNAQAGGLALSGALKPFLSNEGLVAVMPAPDKAALLDRWQAIKGGKAQQGEELRQYLCRWAGLVDAANPPFVRLGGYTDSARPTDLIHPNQAGHLHMAAVLFKLMSADGLVSEVVIDASASRLVEARKAAVRDLTFAGGTLSFRRKDECLPLPIDPVARGALGVDVTTALGSPRDLFGLSRYMLTVSHLPPGDYDLAVDGETIATVGAERLAKGFDAGVLDKGPVAAQARRLLDAVRSRSIRAVGEKGQTLPAAAAVPVLLDEAQPTEHVWTLTPHK